MLTDSFPMSPIQVDADMLAERHQLVFVSNSAQPMLGPITREAHWEMVKAAHAAGMTSEQHQMHKEREAARAISAIGAHRHQGGLTRQLQAVHQSGSEGSMVGVAPLHPGLHSPTSIMNLASMEASSNFMAGPLSPDIEVSFLPWNCSRGYLKLPTLLH